MPAQPAIMFTGLLVIAGGLIHPALGQAFGWLAWPFLVWITGIVEWVAALPFAAFDTGPLPIAPAVLYYLLLGAAAAYLVLPPARRGQLRAALPRTSRLWAALAVALAMVAALVWFAALGQSDWRLHVTFLDVGQGDATLVKTPSGQLVVIDGGPSPTSLNDAVSRSLPFYQRDIALAVLTRATDEKLAGLVSLLERYHVAQLVAPGNPLAGSGQVLPRSATALRFRQLLAQPALGVISPTLGLRLDLGDGAALEVVRVGDDVEGLSLRLSYGQVSVYFDGDSGETQHLASPPDAPATVLRVGRHGDAKAATPQLLSALAPQFAIISVGANNRSGAPSDDTLSRLRESGATVYRTDENGTIRLTTDGAQVWIETEK